MRKCACENAKYIVYAALMAGMTGQAEAADYLRGIFETAPPPPPSAYIKDEVDWAGFYGGVFAGATSGKVNQLNNGLSLVNEALPHNAVGDDLAILIRFKDRTTTKLSGGAFLGFNTVWDDVVLGLEADYTHSNLDAKSTYSEGRRFDSEDGSTFHIGRADSRTQTTLKDWGTLRGRVGWAAGNFMPFMTAGLAFGNLKSSSSTVLSLAQYQNVTIEGCTVVPCTIPVHVSGGSDREGKLKHNGVLYGAAFGAGIDYAFSSNFFVRAEWQYIQFASDKNRPDISVNTARIAGAMKF